MSKRKFLRSVLGIGMTHTKKYTNGSFKISTASFYKLCSRINRELSSKNEMKKYENFFLKVLFQAASESYLIHRATNNKTLVILVTFDSSVKWPFKKKSRNDSSAIEEKKT